MLTPVTEVFIIWAPVNNKQEFCASSVLAGKGQKVSKQIFKTTFSSKIGWMFVTWIGHNMQFSIIVLSKS